MAENFDDIILEQNTKNEKVKKILLRIIALVILFLVALIVIKLVRGDERAGQSIIQGEPISADIPVSDGIENDKFTELERQMQNEANASTASSGSVLSGLDGEINISKILETPLPPEAEMPSVSTNTSNVTSTSNATSANAVKKPATSGAASAGVPNASTKNASKTSTKTAEKPKTPAKPVPLKATDEVIAGTYIQVFSVKKLNANSHEIKKIQKNGYEYKALPTGKSVKILIGPFDRDEIADELKKVRENINSGAFRVTVNE